MAISPKQKQILDFAFKHENRITKKEAVELIGNGYFFNAGKYVGDILGRMVKSQLLNRIKNGLFEINTNRTQTIKAVINSNQLELTLNL